MIIYHNSSLAMLGPSKAQNIMREFNSTISEINHSVGVIDESSSSVIAPTSSNSPQKPAQKAVRQLTSYADLLDINLLKQIKEKFSELTDEDDADESLTISNFTKVLSAFIPLSEVETVVKKIDVNDDGHIDWYEFTGFLINTDTDQGSASNAGAMYLPAETVTQAHDRYVHRDMVDHIVYASKPVPMLITGSA